jgi:hypothetical protein
MSYQVVVLVLYDPFKLPDILAAWEAVGIHGATVLYSTGLGRLNAAKGLRDDLPLMPSLEDFYSNPDEIGRTIFSVVEGDEAVKAISEATRKVLGDLHVPQTGLLMVLPLTYVEGLIPRKS